MPRTVYSGLGNWGWKQGPCAGTQTGSPTKAAEYAINVAANTKRSALREKSSIKVINTNMQATLSPSFLSGRTPLCFVYPFPFLSSHSFSGLLKPPYTDWDFSTSLASLPLGVWPCMRVEKKPVLQSEFSLCSRLWPPLCVESTVITTSSKLAF